MRKIEFGKLIQQAPVNPGFYSDTGPYVAFIKGEIKSIDTVGFESSGVRIIDNYEKNFEIINRLRKNYRENISGEWYFRFKGPYPSHGYTHLIDFSKDETTVGTNQIQCSEEILKNLHSFSKAKVKETLLSYGEGKCIIEKLPDIGNCIIDLKLNKLRGEELMLHAFKDTKTEKFKEVMDIYFSLINSNENFKKCTTHLIRPIGSESKKDLLNFLK